MQAARQFLIHQVTARSWNDDHTRNKTLIDLKKN